MSSAVAKITNVAKLTATPVTKVSAIIYKNAVKRNKDMPADFQEEAAKHHAAGTDFASTTTANFIAMQFKLVPYRIERLGFELDYAWNNCCNFKNYTWKDWVVEFRFFVRLLFLYMATILMGRQSVMPLLEPNSPFCEQLKYTNPNRSN
jgi:hypothetical protein